jgi:serine/threonine protein kinase
MRLSPDDKLGIPAKSAMEMAALSTLRHPNIVTCYACLTDMVQETLPAAIDLSSTSSSTFLKQQQGAPGIRFRLASAADLADSSGDSFNILVMERCDRGNLADAVRCEGLLHRRGPDGMLRVSMGLLITVLLDVAAALRYMHSLGLVHLDVKAANVLLATTAGRPGGFPLAELGDLGLVKLLGEGGAWSTAARPARSRTWRQSGCRQTASSHPRQTPAASACSCTSSTRGSSPMQAASTTSA